MNTLARRAAGFTPYAVHTVRKWGILGVFENDLRCFNNGIRGGGEIAPSHAGISRKDLPSPGAAAPMRGFGNELPRGAV